MEVLPAVTAEDIEAAVDFLQLASIGEIELQGLVLALLRVLLPSTTTILYLVVPRDFAVLLGDVPTSCGAVVETEVQIGAEAFKELELVVELSVTHEAAHVGVLVLLVQLSNRVQQGHRVGQTADHPIVIATVFVVDGLQRVVLHGLADSTLVGE